MDLPGLSHKMKEEGIKRFEEERRLQSVFDMKSEDQGLYCMGDPEDSTHQSHQECASKCRRGEWAGESRLMDHNGVWGGAVKS